MHAKSTAVRERVHKYILVGEIRASHRLEEIYYLRQLEIFAAWRRTNGFDRADV